MKKFLLALAMLVGAAPAYASYAVYPGCTVPGTPAGNTWYVDPVNGKTPAAGGLGTQAAPWNSIQGILQWWQPAGYTRPLLSSVPYYHTVGGKQVYVADQIGSPPVQPGDTVLLMSGDHGAVSIGDYNSETVNSDFVTFKAAPGQTPQFDSLTISRAQKFIFDGIKVQSVSSPSGNYGASLVTINDQGASYPTSDIILANLDVSALDHTAAALALLTTQAALLAVVHGGVASIGTAGNGTNGQPYTTCVSVTNSHIHDVYQGALLFSNNILFSNNTLDHFAADGIDFGASNLTISNNYEHDNQTVDGNHEDAMQGQNGPLAPGVAYNKFSNILIDSNLVIRHLDPNLLFPTYLQGISVFDEDWTNITVTNNVIVSGSCHGIDISSAHNGLIANNTVVDDLDSAETGATQCAPIVDFGPLTHESTYPTSNSRITNNAAPSLYVPPTGVTADHNVIQCCGTPGFARIVWYVNGAPVYIGASGTYANNNIIDTVGAAGEFATFSPSTYTYNLAPKAGAPLIGGGSQVGAPTTMLDILGALRTAPWTVGAFNHYGRSLHPR
jgi:parallel beta-helix repeat protein